MIAVTRFNGSKMYINAELVQTVEGVPDTIITLTDNTKIIVKEPPDIVVAEIIAYRRKIHGSRVASRVGE